MDKLAKLTDYFFDIDLDKYVAYFPETCGIYRVNAKTKCILESLLGNNTNFPTFFSKPTEDDILQCKALIEKNKIDLSHQETQTTFSEKHLSRLVIHVSNQCNLACRYCYANGGSYMSSADNIDTPTIDRIVDVFFSYYDKIDTVMFFGGEPLLNIEGIEYACQKITEFASNKEYLPKFGIVTNGTIVNDTVIKLINKYSIGVTVSYDGFFGNEKIRVDKNNCGTANLVLKNIAKLKEATGEPTLIETTYGQAQVDSNISIEDVITEIRNHFPDTPIHLAPVMGSNSYILKDIKPFIDSVHTFFTKYNQGVPVQEIPTYSILERILKPILTKAPRNSKVICGAGESTISVSIHGKIYPCFMFTDFDTVCLGNVFDAEPLSCSEFMHMRNCVLEQTQKATHVECLDCYASTICSGCFGSCSIDNTLQATLDPRYCTMVKDMLQASVIHVAMDSYIEGGIQAS